MSDFEAWYFGMFPLEKAMIEAGSAASARNRDLYLRCWQASRAALEVDWPNHYGYTDPDVAGAAILDCRTAFKEAAAEKVEP